MRKIDKKKISDIQTAVYDLVDDAGLIDLSMSKIAKHADVSPATIYIYYRDKQDLLLQSYIQAQGLIDDRLEEVLDPEDTFPNQFRAGLLHFAECFQQYPKQANFIWSFSNNYKKIAGQHNSLIIKELIAAAVAQNLLVSRDDLILQSLSFGTLMDYIQNGGEDITAMVNIIVNRLFK